MDHQAPISTLAVAIRTIVEACGFEASAALSDAQLLLSPEQWLEQDFKVFPIPHTSAVAKPKPWKSHGISFSRGEIGIIVHCKDHAADRRVIVEVVAKQRLQGMSHKPPVARSIPPKESYDIN